MKYRIFSYYLFLIIFLLPLEAKKAIDLTAIYKEYKFYPNMLSSLHSLKDGTLHYT